MEFSLTEVREATGGELLGTIGSVCTGISIDSRRLKPGDLFVAIIGERHDGHAFVQAAVAAGAPAVVVSRPVDVPEGTGVVLVKDTTAALGGLARHHRRRFSLPVVAVTGSSGKTTVKEMIAAVAAVKHRVAKTVGNRNNEIGLPLTLLGLDRRDEILVVEMGMRGPGQIAALAAVAEPDIGVVTNIGLTHLELLGTREAIAAAKGELLAALPRDGTAVINADDPYYETLAAMTGARVLSFGFGDAARVRGSAFKPAAEGSVLSVDGPSFSGFRLVLRAPGRHHAIDALAAAAAACALGYTTEEIQAGLEGFAPERGRGAALQSERGFVVLDDTYNANPDSMAAALAVLAAQPCTGRRMAVLADMLELGPSAQAAHREIGKTAAAAGIALLLTTGDLATEIAAGAKAAGFPATRMRHYPDRRALIADLQEIVRAGDVVLVKGSRGMHMEEVVDALMGGNA